MCLASPCDAEGRIPSPGESHGTTCRVKARENTQAERCTVCCRSCRWPTAFLLGLQPRDYCSCCCPSSYLLSSHVKPKPIFHHPFFVSPWLSWYHLLFPQAGDGKALSRSLPAGPGWQFCFVYGFFQFSHIIMSICSAEMNSKNKVTHIH